MGILSNILGKIFPSSQTSPAPAPTAPATSAGAPAAGVPPGSGSPAAAPVAMSEVDVEKILDDMTGKAGQQLNWRTSIVDLMKLLGLDSSLDARKELAKELNYTGETSDSAAMNVWLHRQVMTKVAANGGKVPADLKD